jgi:homopolymeric O-antigen transport system ATP-binding protein
MSTPIISVENLSKRYLVGHQEARTQFRYTALRDVIGRELRNYGRKALDVVRGRQVVQGDQVEEFWALKDINFEVQEGEVLGIIGRNGAGKSTLLKILSRITEPTAGRITLRGRVASLLEVGTGFHPELTGRENIFLNGAILGMSRAEIRKKFDEIVAFAEVEKFLDTPVKRYSSGMYVRLAFAVAAHLEPEILIVDEVLAVGDAEFQKKCLGKMDEVSRREGRTVLFVSHNMSAIAELARRAVLLDRGLIVLDGPVSDVLAAYLSKSGTRTDYVTAHNESYENPHIARAEVITSDLMGIHRFGEPLDINIWIRHRRPLRSGCFAVQIMNQSLLPIIHAYAYPPEDIFGLEPGVTCIRFHFPKILLNVGRFHLRTWLNDANHDVNYEVLNEICHFEVVRYDRNVLRGWRQDVCAYQENFTLEITKLLGSDTESACHQLQEIVSV